MQDDHDKLWAELSDNNRLIDNIGALWGDLSEWVSFDADRQAWVFSVDWMNTEARDSEGATNSKSVDHFTSMLRCSFSLVLGDDHYSSAVEEGDDTLFVSIETVRAYIEKRSYNESPAAHIRNAHWNYLVGKAAKLAKTVFNLPLREEANAEGYTIGLRQAFEDLKGGGHQYFLCAYSSQKDWDLFIERNRSLGVDLKEQFNHVKDHLAYMPEYLNFSQMRALDRVFGKARNESPITPLFFYFGEMGCCSSLDRYVGWHYGVGEGLHYGISVEKMKILGDAGISIDLWPTVNSHMLACAPQTDDLCKAWLVGTGLLSWVNDKKRIDLGHGAYISCSNRQEDSKSSIGLYFGGFEEGDGRNVDCAKDLIMQFSSLLNAEGIQTVLPLVSREILAQNANIELPYEPVHLLLKQGKKIDLGAVVDKYKLS